jgi:hypothetical protein
MLLARHPLAPVRGQMIVDAAHWAELPDGHTRSTTLDTAAAEPVPAQQGLDQAMSTSMVFGQSQAALEVTVARRPLATTTDSPGWPRHPTPPGRPSPRTSRWWVRHE